jgi:hypothetical protein
MESNYLMDTVAAWGDEKAQMVMCLVNVLDATSKWLK